MDVLVGLMLLVVMLGLYVIPWIVAALRRAPHVGVVAVINVFLGWTLIGWLVALAMACRSRPSTLEAAGETAATQDTGALPATALLSRECPHCEQQMPCEARSCTHCHLDSESWTRVGGRWWQLHDGPPHYWNEQTQQWTEAPLPASPQLGSDSPVSHDLPGERRPDRRLLYLVVALAALVAAAVAVAALVDGGSNEDAVPAWITSTLPTTPETLPATTSESPQTVSRKPLEYHYRLEQAVPGGKFRLGDSTDIYLSSPDLPPGKRVRLTYELCVMTTKHGKHCYRRPQATLAAGDWILDTWRLDAGEEVNGALRLTARIQGHEVAHLTVPVSEG